jgi:two-component system response regulator FixJ
MRNAMSFVLQAAGLRIITFDSAAAFLEGAVLRTLACIVLDLRMPGMTGLDLLQKLAGEPAVPPVILVSAHLDETIEKNARDAGVAACIRKPFTDEALMHAVHIALRR